MKVFEFGLSPEVQLRLIEEKVAELKEVGFRAVVEAIALNAQEVGERESVQLGTMVLRCTDQVQNAKRAIDALEVFAANIKG